MVIRSSLLAHLSNILFDLCKLTGPRPVAGPYMYRRYLTAEHQSTTFLLFHISIGPTGRATTIRPDARGTL